MTGLRLPGLARNPETRFAAGALAHQTDSQLLDQFLTHRYELASENSSPGTVPWSSESPKHPSRTKIPKLKSTCRTLRRLNSHPIAKALHS
jgi:hypothetical protein